MKINWVKAKENAEKCFTDAHTKKVRIETKLLKYLLLWHGDTSFFEGHPVELKKRSFGCGYL